MKDRFLEEDLNYIANSTLPFEELYGSSILVTGGTGLVGSQLIKALMMMNSKKEANIKVYAIVRNLEKAEAIYADMECHNLNFILGDVTEEIEVTEPIDYIVHAASPTASKFFVEKPVETIHAAFAGTNQMLKLAAKKQVKGMVYISSMEMYGRPDPNLECVKENDLGYIDVLNVRSSYSEGKRICECLCASYAKEYGVNVKIARLAQTFGSGITMAENRVFAQFAKSAMFKKDIVLHTAGKSYGNYCYTRDAIMGILLLLIRGKQGEAYTVANEATNITIGNMAKMVAEEIAGGEIKVVFDIPEDALTYGYAPDVKMKLNSDKLQALGWKPEVGLKEAYERMMGSMKLDLES